MNVNDRRKKIMDMLSNSSEPVSATSLAEALDVSRQVIVGDIAILRAEGNTVIATPRGYILQYPDKGVRYQIACRHDSDGILDELYAIVDNGCTVLDVIVEHPVYGQISGMLQLSSRKDVQEFVYRCSFAQPLSNLTGGLHLHTLSCPSAEAFSRVKSTLLKLGILLS